ncbi:Hemicentin-1 [Mytilus coruscus]|uniref:Hemicentin-1 n=1 Tax=Mytilus coruscus TaxID=42192 RepID=A0A6J8DGX7_MYTCO|nr:Hemicentin-1 [Mytilus coruscus]
MSLWRRIKRERSCTNPMPLHGGEKCDGLDEDIAFEECNTLKCPIDGGWSPFELWSDWTQCNQSCGGGLRERTRNRSCTNPMPLHGGEKCDGLDEDIAFEDCNTLKCPIDGGWSPFESWSDWTQCNRSCGGGLRERTRNRSCTNPMPLHGGEKCDGLDEDIAFEDCNTMKCPKREPDIDLVQTLCLCMVAKKCNGLDKDFAFEDCNTLECPSFCTCSGYGGIHYNTPDGADIHFMRKSKYILWESTFPMDPCSFRVETKNKRRYGYKHAFYTLFIDLYIVNTTIRILQKATTMVNGIAIELPTLLVNKSIEITRSGSFITAIHSKCNIRVQFDGDHMINVKVSKNLFAGKLTGLCGNCNGNKQDDYQTKVFDAGDQPFFNLVGVHVPRKCLVKDKERTKKDDYCWYLISKSSPFKFCRESTKIDFVKMYSSCEFDVCFSDQDNAHCPTLQRTAFECSQYGYIVKWRNLKFCPLTCKDDFVYKTSVSCTNTCDNPTATQNCQDPPVDGCTCPDKTYLKGDKCVTIDKCGSCYVNIGGILSKLAVGDFYPKGNCTESQKCDMVNKNFVLVPIQPTKICDADELCTANNFGIYDCTKNSKLGDISTTPRTEIAAVSSQISSQLVTEKEEVLTTESTPKEDNFPGTTITVNDTLSPFIPVKNQTNLLVSTQSTLQDHTTKYTTSEAKHSTRNFANITEDKKLEARTTSESNIFSKQQTSLITEEALTEVTTSNNTSPVNGESPVEKVTERREVTASSLNLDTKGQHIETTTANTVNINSKQKNEYETTSASVGITNFIFTTNTDYEYLDKTTTSLMEKLQFHTMSAIEDTTIETNNEKSSTTADIFGIDATSILNTTTYSLTTITDHTKQRTRSSTPRMFTMSEDLSEPVDGGWSSFKSWSAWTHCSRSCGGGMRERIRYRSCTKPSLMHGGKTCNGLDKDIVFEDCNTMKCTRYGGFHYNTPDGADIHFMRTYNYILWESTFQNDPCSFRVETKNKRRYGYKHAFYTLLIDLYIVNTTIRILQNETTMVNDIAIELPTILVNKSIEITRSGSFITAIHSKCNIRVQFDGDHMINVKVSKNLFAGKLTGLCGNCNGNKQDDYRTKSVKVVSGIDWVDKVYDDGDQPFFNLVGVHVPRKCLVKDKERTKKDDYCWYLISKSSPFKFCRESKKVDFVKMYSSCEFDVCFSDQDNAHCPTLQRTAYECSQHGYIVKWRNLKFCPLTCKDDFVYKTSVSCTNTCDNPIATQNCQDPPVDGCTCPDKTYLKGGKCVHLDKCGSCYLNIGGIPSKLAVGDFYPKDNCTVSQKCDMVNKNFVLVPIQQAKICDVDELCTANNFGIYDCTKNPTYDTQRQSLHEKPDNLVKSFTSKDNIPTLSSTKDTQKYVTIKEYNDVNTTSVSEPITNDLKTSKIVRQETTIANPFTSKDSMTNQNAQEMSSTAIIEKEEVLKTTSKEDNFPATTITVNDTLSPFISVKNRTNLLVSTQSTLQEHTTKYTTSKAKQSTGNFSNITEDKNLEARTTSESNVLSNQQTSLITEETLTEVTTSNSTSLVNGKSPVEKVTERHEVTASSLNLNTEGQHMETTTANTVNLNSKQKNIYETSSESVGITNFIFTTKTDNEQLDKTTTSLMEKLQFHTMSAIEDTTIETNNEKLSTTTDISGIDATSILNTTTYSLTTITDHTKQRTRWSTSKIFTISEDLSESGFCTCSGYGGFHYNTPDGANIHFMRTSKYILWESTFHNDPCSFRVETKNKRRYGYKHVFYTLLIDLYIVNTTIRILQKDTTMINGIAIELPTLLVNKSIEITRSGSFITAVHSKCNIRVQFDGDHMINVKVSKNLFAGKLTGLCGNCNGNKQDDYQTTSVKVVSGIDWVDKVYDDGDQPFFNLVGVHVPRKCLVKDKERTKKDDYCWYLISKSSPFKFCRESKKVDFVKMYSNCEFDVCFSDQDNAHCPTLQRTAFECSQHGYIVKWRNLKFCPLTCKDDFVYKTSVACTNTCDNPTATQNCQNQPVDGCTCPDKTYLNGGKCVTIDKCGSCNLKIGGISSKLAVGDFYPKGNCIMSQKCEMVNKNFVLVPIQPAKICDVDELCTVNNFGIYDCTKNSTYDKKPKPNQSKYENVLLVIHKQVTQRQSLHEKTDNSVKFLTSKQSIPTLSSTNPTKKYVTIKAYNDVNTTSVSEPITNDLKTSEIVRQETMIANPFTSKDIITNQNAQEMSTTATVLKTESTSKEDNFPATTITVNDTLSPFIPVNNRTNLLVSTQSTLQEHTTKYTTSEGKQSTRNFSNITEDKNLEAKTTSESNILSKQQTSLITEEALTEVTTSNSTSLVNGKSPVEKVTERHEVTTSSLNLNTEGQHMETTTANTANLNSKQKNEYETSSESVGITNFIFTTKTDNEQLDKTTASLIEKLQFPTLSTIEYTTIETNDEKSSTTTDIFGIDALSILNPTTYSLTTITDHTKQRARSSTSQVFTMSDDLSDSGFCTCSGYGGFHYNTPDGADIHFMRTSTYILWESTFQNDPCSFRVETKNKRRYGYKHAFYTLLIDLYIVNTTIRILQNDYTMVNGIAIELPTLLVSKSMEITRSGSFITAIHSKCNIRVQFDGDHMINVKVSKNLFAGKLTGLCGNCNGNKQDDYQTKVFDDGDQPFFNLVGVHVPRKCLVKDKERTKKDDYCWYLISKSSPFKFCRDSKKVDFVKMYSSCEFDVCFSDQDNAHCPTLQRTAFECSQHGYIVKWRNLKFCPLTCKDDFVHKTSVSCTNTCDTPIATQNCQDPPVDGCTCPNKTYLNGGKCVTIDKCGSCNLNIGGISSKLAVGDFYPKGNCTVSQKCDMVNKNFVLVPIQPAKICDVDELCTANNFGIYHCTKNSRIHMPEQD